MDLPRPLRQLAKIDHIPLESQAQTGHLAHANPVSAMGESFGGT